MGDIESMAFIEAFRQFEFRVKRENFCNIHVSLVPTPKTTGEQKTKPTQKSLHELRGLGLVADMVIILLNMYLITLTFTDAYTILLLEINYRKLHKINYK